MIASFALMLGRDFVIRNVTSRSLGSLAPGYAATPRGFMGYAFLVFDIGLVLIAIYLSIPWLIIATLALFVLASVTVIVGEVVTYRNLKR